MALYRMHTSCRIIPFRLVPITGAVFDQQNVTILLNYRGFKDIRLV